MIWWTTLALGAPTAAPSTSIDATVLRALSLRHPVPCEQVTASTSEPTAQLLAVVAQVSMPPWAPMRAADCLVREHADEPDVASAMREWVVDPDRKGLGRLVVARLDAIEAPVAVELATRAWQAGHDRDYVSRRLADSEREEIRAVAR